MRPATGQPPPGGGWTRYEPKATFTGDDPAFASGRRGRQGGGGRRRRRGRLVGYFLVAVFALVIGAGVGYARAYFSDGEVGGTVTVVVKEGSSLQGIAAQLEEKGVVKHARAFVIRADADGYATRFMPGTYAFRVNEPYDELVAKLLKGVKPPATKVSIPEGTTLKQAAVIVSGDVEGISAADYVKVARDDPPPFTLQGYKQGTTLEGMLFPATYEVPLKATARSVVRDQLTAFEDNFAAVDMSRAAAANLTEYDVVIVASIIDREIRIPAERRMAAAVIWNRLRKDMMLQMCSTVEYALGKTKPVLSFDDLKIDSPYNTYRHAGLPPAPISNPGVAAMKAAADPADVDYLYFVARDDGSYRHYFSSTYEQFQADTAKAAANRE
jgi:UPF0755 protein